MSEKLPLPPSQIVKRVPVILPGPVPIVETDVITGFPLVPKDLPVARVAGIGKGEPFVMEACRSAFVDRVGLLGLIADGKGERVIVKSRGGVEVETSKEAPSHRDRLQAMALLAKYGGLDREVEAPPEMDQAQMLEAFVKALRDPGVRAYMREAYPDLLQALGEEALQAERTEVVV